MLGSTQNNVPKTAVAAPAALQVPTVVGGAKSSTQENEDHKQATPLVLAILVGLYFLWAAIERHEKVQNAIKPQAIAMNVRNLAVIALSVIVSMNLLRIGLAKGAASGWPFVSPVCKVLLKVVGNV